LPAVLSRVIPCGGYVERGGDTLAGAVFTAGHGLTVPPCKVGGYLAVVFGVTNPSASLLLAASHFYHLDTL
tara:strand:+ start:1490 stop:1702 length:213 start_codon:yes stop_codon:yes gene_type:complete